MQRAARRITQEHPNLIRLLFRIIEDYLPGIGMGKVKDKIESKLPKWIFEAAEQDWKKKLELLKNKDAPSWIAFSIVLFKLEISRKDVGYTQGEVNSILFKEIPKWVFEATSHDWKEFIDELLKDPKLTAWLVWNIDILEKVLYDE